MDHRAKVVVTIVGGADVSDIVFDSPITYGIQPGFHYHGVTYDSLKRDMAPIEPANWLHGFDPHNALLFNGRYDVFISPKQAHHLSEALGGAPIVWTNTQGITERCLPKKKSNRPEFAFCALALDWTPRRLPRLPRCRHPPLKSACWQAAMKASARRLRIR